MSNWSHSPFTVDFLTVNPADRLQFVFFIGNWTPHRKLNSSKSIKDGC